MSHIRRAMSINWNRSSEFTASINVHFGLSIRRCSSTDVKYLNHSEDMEWSNQAKSDNYAGYVEQILNKTRGQSFCLTHILSLFC